MTTFYSDIRCGLLLALASLLLIGCGGTGEDPGPEGGTCEPVPESQLEDCEVDAPRRVETQSGLQQICESACRNIDELMLVQVPGLKNLNALSNKVVKDITLEDLPELQSTAALQLESGGSLIVRFAPNLESLDAMQGVTELSRLSIEGVGLEDFQDVGSLEELVPDSSGLGGYLTVMESELNDYSPFEGLDVTNDELTFQSNDGLTELPQLSGEVSQIFLRFNDNLTDISALRSLDGISQGITIRGNSSLSSCHIQDVLEDVQMGSNASVVVEENSSQPCN